jgi:multidrug resistance protein MdtO
MQIALAFYLINVTEFRMQTSLRLLAQFARESVSKDLKAATARRFGRDHQHQPRQGKGSRRRFLLEFGRSRAQGLELRNLIRAQPQMRALFIMQVAEWKYRARLPGFELPDLARAKAAGA